MKRVKRKSRFDRLAADTKNPPAVDHADQWQGFRRPEYMTAAEAVSHFDKHTRFQIPEYMEQELLQEASLKILSKIGRKETVTSSSDYANTKLDTALLVFVGSRATRDATYWVNDCTVHLPRDAFKPYENVKPDDEIKCDADKWKKHEFSDEALEDFGRNRFSRSEAQEQCEYYETLEWIYKDLCQDETDRRMVHYLGVEELSLDETADKLEISRRQVTNRLIDLQKRRRAWEWN